MAGFLASNVIDGLCPLAPWAALSGETPLPRDDYVLLDVRHADEYAAEHVAHSVNISLEDIRNKSALARMRELTADASKPVFVYCIVGQRAYYAVRALRTHGIDARLLSGGITTAKLLDAANACRVESLPPLVVNSQ